VAGEIAADMLVNRWSPSGVADLNAALHYHERVLDELANLLRNGLGIIRFPQASRSEPHARVKAYPVVGLEEAANRPLQALLGLLDAFPKQHAGSWLKCDRFC
jgi:hypothetical protein